ncbi:MAG: DUF1292 domain-containing protein [Ruminococcus sp.]|nr:DUF1292 domain-containing protein [Ruminococcus sp.]
MSDIIENNNEELEDNENYITLTDDDGNDVSFEILDFVTYKEHDYAVLLPFDEEDDGIVILEVVPAEDPEYDDFIAVDDEALLEEIYTEFKNKYEGDYEFE